MGYIDFQTLFSHPRGFGLESVWADMSEAPGREAGAAGGGLDVSAQVVIKAGKAGVSAVPRLRTWRVRISQHKYVESYFIYGS